MVVVLIPPAVEPGEPPVIINIIIIKTPASLSAVKSTVLKPAVLGVTDWKKEPKIRSDRLISLHLSAENSTK